MYFLWSQIGLSFWTGLSGSAGGDDAAEDLDTELDGEEEESAGLKRSQGHGGGRGEVTPEATSCGECDGFQAEVPR